MQTIKRPHISSCWCFQKSNLERARQTMGSPFLVSHCWANSANIGLASTWRRGKVGGQVAKLRVVSLEGRRLFPGLAHPGAGSRPAEPELALSLLPQRALMVELQIGCRSSGWSARFGCARWRSIRDERRRAICINTRRR